MTRIVRWNPLREMAQMQNALDRILDETWGNVDQNRFVTGRNWLALDVHENDEAYVVVADFPGVMPDAIDVTLHENTLTISGEIQKAEVPEGTQTLLNERVFGTFRRNITLPSHVDADNVIANYNEGVLTLNIPKSEESRPRQIAVNAGNLVHNQN